MLLSAPTAPAEPEIEIRNLISVVTVWGKRDCHGKLAAECGNLHDMYAFRPLRARAGRQRQRGRPVASHHKGEKPKSEQNSNKQSEEDCKSTRNPVLIATGEKHKDAPDFAAGGNTA